MVINHVTNWGDPPNSEFISRSIHETKRYIYLHEWLVFMVNLGKYTIHGWYEFGFHGMSCEKYFLWKENTNTIHGTGIIYLHESLLCMVFMWVFIAVLWMLWVGFFNRELEEIPGGDVNPMGNRIRLENISPTKTNSKRIGDRSTQKISGDFFWVKGKKTGRVFGRVTMSHVSTQDHFHPSIVFLGGKGGKKLKARITGL